MCISKNNPSNRIFMVIGLVYFYFLVSMGFLCAAGFPWNWLFARLYLSRRLLPRSKLLVTVVWHRRQPNQSNRRAVVWAGFWFLCDYLAILWLCQCLVARLSGEYGRDEELLLVRIQRMFWLKCLRTSILYGVLGIHWLDVQSASFSTELVEIIQNS